MRLILALSLVAGRKYTLGLIILRVATLSVPRCDSMSSIWVIAVSTCVCVCVCERACKYICAPSRTDETLRREKERHTQETKSPCLRCLARVFLLKMWVSVRVQQSENHFVYNVSQYMYRIRKDVWINILRRVIDCYKNDSFGATESRPDFLLSN